MHYVFCPEVTKVTCVTGGPSACFGKLTQAFQMDDVQGEWMRAGHHPNDDRHVLETDR